MEILEWAASGCNFAPGAEKEIFKKKAGLLIRLGKKFGAAFGAAFGETAASQTLAADAVNLFFIEEEEIPSFVLRWEEFGSTSSQEWEVDHYFEMSETLEKVSDLRASLSEKQRAFLKRNSP